MLIYWTDTAKESFEEELDFIFKKWGLNQVSKFIDLVDNFAMNLIENPLKGKKSLKIDVYTFVISKQTTVVYQVIKEKQQIDLLYFWNNKRNPNDLSPLLK